MTIHGMLKCGFIDPGSGSDIRESSISVLVFYEDHYLQSTHRNSFPAKTSPEEQPCVDEDGFRRHIPAESRMRNSKPTRK